MNNFPKLFYFIYYYSNKCYNNCRPTTFCVVILFLEMKYIFYQNTTSQDDTRVSLNRIKYTLCEHQTRHDKTPKNNPVQWASDRNSISTSFLPHVHVEKNFKKPVENQTITQTCSENIISRENYREIWKFQHRTICCIFALTRGLYLTAVKLRRSGGSLL